MKNVDVENDALWVGSRKNALPGSQVEEQELLHPES